MSSNEELAVLAKSGDKQVIYTLWTQVEKLCSAFSARFIAKFQKRCNACGITNDDLMQECFIALLEAVQAYKPESEYKFTTYLYRYVLNRFNALSGYRTKRAMNDPINNSKSLHEAVSEIEDITIMETLPDDTATEEFENIIEREYTQELHNALDEVMEQALTPKQERIIKQYFYNGLTLHELGTMEGNSTERIRQVKAAAIRQMRKPQYARNLTSFAEWSNMFFSGSLSHFKTSMASNTELIVELSERYTASRCFI